MMSLSGSANVAQIRTTGPIVLVNDFTDEEAFLKAWQDDALFMKQQPGFISTQLHRAIGESPTYLDYAVWETAGHFRAASQIQRSGQSFRSIIPSAKSVQRVRLAPFRCCTSWRFFWTNRLQGLSFFFGEAKMNTLVWRRSAWRASNSQRRL